MYPNGGATNAHGALIRQLESLQTNSISTITSNAVIFHLIYRRPERTVYRKKLHRNTV